MKHIHQYRRVNIGMMKDYIVYRCSLPNCKHYVTPVLLEGREAQCPRCQSVFVIEKKHLALANPHCDNCIVKREEKSA